MMFDPYWLVIYPSLLVICYITPNLGLIPPLIKWLDPAHGFRHQFVKENHTSQSIPIAYPHYQYPFRIPSSIKKYIPYTVNIH